MGTARNAHAESVRRALRDSRSSIARARARAEPRALPALLEERVQQLLLLGGRLRDGLRHGLALEDDAVDHVHVELALGGLVDEEGRLGVGKAADEGAVLR